MKSFKKNQKGSGKKKKNKEKQLYPGPKQKRVYSQSRKKHRESKRSERKKRYNLSDSSEFKSVSQKLDEHLSESSGLGIYETASEKYSEKGLRVKSMEENNKKLIEQIISLKNGIYSPNILNKTEFAHILTTNDYLDDYQAGAPIKMSHIAHIYLSLKYPGICIPDKMTSKHGFIHSYVDDHEGGLYWCQNASGPGPGPESEPSSINSSDEVLGGGGLQRQTCLAETLQFEGQDPVTHLDPEIIKRSTFAINFKRCMSLPVSVSRFIIIILNIWNCNGGGHHANVLIYDKTNNTLERYEPNGTNTNFYNSFKLDRALERAFSTISDNPISELGGTFIGPHSFTGFGIQNMEGLNPRTKPSTKTWDSPISIEEGL